MIKVSTLKALFLEKCSSEKFLNCINGISSYVSTIWNLQLANADQLIETLGTGNQYRDQQATDANQTSSRCHAVFSVILTQKQVFTGSVRASIAYKEKVRSKVLHREGWNINKSLLASGNCINALATKMS